MGKLKFPLLTPKSKDTQNLRKEGTCTSILCLSLIFFNSPITHYFSFKQGLALQLFHLTIGLLLMMIQNQIPMSQLASSPSDSVPQHMKVIQYFQQAPLYFLTEVRSHPFLPFFCLAHLDHWFIMCLHPL